MRAAGTLTERLRRAAEVAGLDVLGITSAEPFEEYALPDSPRRDPSISLNGARAIIVGGVYIGGLTLARWADPWFGRTSRLYLSGYFLDVVAPMESLAEVLRDEGYSAVVCNGSDPDGSVIPLKLAARRAGLGWQGKNSLLLSRTYGTFLALGGLITDAQLDPEGDSEPDRCGRCTRCRDACPTRAIDHAYVLDRSRCLSSLLSSDNLPLSARAIMQNRVVDCEICQDVCPWNRKHIESPLATPVGRRLDGRRDALERFFPLERLADLDEAEYERSVADLQADIPFEVFHRNVLLALENARHA